MLTVAEHSQSVQRFGAMMFTVLPPPNGDASLVARAEAIRGGYGCSRSADAIYIALAEELSIMMPTVILTFDQNMQNQVARHALSVTVHTL
jgi:hypothetical protein